MSTKLTCSWFQDTILETFDNIVPEGGIDTTTWDGVKELVKHSHARPRREKEGAYSGKHPEARMLALTSLPVEGSNWTEAKDRLTVMATKLGLKPTTGRVFATARCFYLEVSP